MLSFLNILFRKEAQFISIVIFGCLFYLNAHGNPKPVSAVNTRLDSLLNQVNEKKQDSSQVKNYFELCWELLYSDPEKGRSFGEKGLKLAKKIKWKEGERRCYHAIALTYYVLDDFVNSIEYNKKALAIAKSEKNLKAQADSYNNMGMNYEAIAKYPEALSCYIKGIGIIKQRKNQEGLALLYGNLGNVYISTKDHAKAIKYHKQSYAYAERYKDTSAMINAEVNLGLIYQRTEQLDTALLLFKNALQKAKAVNYTTAIYSLHNNLGTAYTDNGEYEKAITELMISYKFYSDQNYPDDLSITSGNLGIAYLNMGKYDLAQKYFLQTRNLSVKTNAKEIQMEVESYLSELFEKKGDFKKALEFHKSWLSLRDSLENKTLTKKIAQREAEFEVQKKMTADSIYNLQQQKVRDERISLQQKEIRQSRIFAFVLITGIIGILFFLILYVRRLKETKRQKRIIEEKNKETELQKIVIEEKQIEILDSIKYAKRIQQSLLPNEKIINRNLKRLKK